MNIMSFNIQGCGIAMIRRRLKQMICNRQADMFFLQETKMMGVTDDFISSL